MEATFVLSRNPPEPKPVSVPPQYRPRTVHWSGRDIYPLRLSCGHRLRCITFAETWSDTGMDYEVEVPQLAGCVTYTRFPLWLVNPLLMEVVVSGYTLWHSHERFSRWIGKERMDDAYSSPFRMRRMDFLAPPPKEGARVKCYLRLTGVTPKSHLCDIIVSDGDGGAIATISGWEERVEHVRSEYRDLIMQPATSFVTKSIPAGKMGSPSLDVSSAFVTDVPYPVFERNDEVWLQTFAHMVLSEKERADFRRMPGSAARRTEWLFGRIAAKEAVRRFLKDYYQARWSYADVTIFADDMGKPYAVGAWMDQLPAKLDIAIAHTSQFVIGLAAANARVGVDVESVGRDLSQEFTDGVFMPDELELAARAAGGTSQAILRFWCAKEAVSKALGTGIRYSPREMVVSDYEPEAGRLSMRLTGAWGDAFRGLKGRDIPVTVATMNDHALAFCFLPAALFAEE
jgi:phosphopantetheine--protein transferase-like protein